MHIDNLISRVEGHGKIALKIEGEKVISVDLDILTPPRLFEKLIVGRNYNDVPSIVSRICSICSASHRVVSVMAIENAFGIEVSEGTKILRELLLHGELLESHGLHLFFLAIPDYLGYSSFIEIAEKRPDIAKLGFRIKEVGNTIQEKIGGRAIHQITPVVGGMSYVPPVNDLRLIKDMAGPLISEVRDFFKGTTFIKDDNDIKLKNWVSIDTVTYSYPGIGPNGKTSLLVNGSKKIEVKDFYKEFKESSFPPSFAKHTLYKGESFMVGALPRMLNSGKKLKGTAGELRKKLIGNNSKSIYANNLCQGIEIIHSLERCVETIDFLCRSKIDATPTHHSLPITRHSSVGLAAIEAPRGLLIHTYNFDDRRYVVDGNITTPTALTLSDMERNLRTLAEKLIKEKSDIRPDLESLVRAYDPCISCSVHIIKL